MSGRKASEWVSTVRDEEVIWCLYCMRSYNWRADSTGSNAIEDEVPRPGGSAVSKEGREAGVGGGGG